MDHFFSDTISGQIVSTAHIRAGLRPPRLFCSIDHDEDADAPQLGSRADVVALFERIIETWNRTSGWQLSLGFDYRGQRFEFAAEGPRGNWDRSISLSDFKDILSSLLPVLGSNQLPTPEDSRVEVHFEPEGRVGL